MGWPSSRREKGSDCRSPWSRRTERGRSLRSRSTTWRTAGRTTVRACCIRHCRRPRSLASRSAGRSSPRSPGRWPTTPRVCSRPIPSRFGAGSELWSLPPVAGRVRGGCSRSSSGRKTGESAEAGLLRSLDALVVATRPDEVTLGEWFTRWDSGPAPLVIDRVALASAGWGPKSRVVPPRFNARARGPHRPHWAPRPDRRSPRRHVADHRAGARPQTIRAPSEASPGPRSGRPR